MGSEQVSQGRERTPEPVCPRAGHGQGSWGTTWNPAGKDMWVFVFRLPPCPGFYSLLPTGRVAGACRMLSACTGSGCRGHVAETQRHRL